MQEFLNISKISIRVTICKIFKKFDALNKFLDENQLTLSPHKGRGERTHAQEDEYTPLREVSL